MGEQAAHPVERWAGRARLDLATRAEEDARRSSRRVRVRASAMAIDLGPRQDLVVGAVEYALEEMARDGHGRVGVGGRARLDEERELLHVRERGGGVVSSASSTG